MSDWIEKINKLDLDLFETVPSQTSDGDRRSLLAVQRATAQKYKDYVYLEIGSYLGGSIQPHLVDKRCKIIYSIDARPEHQPDDRPQRDVAQYPENSTEKMLDLLGRIDNGDVTKIQCFDLDASKIDTDKITPRPQLAFIDGEHTKSAVLSDFQFCRKVISKNGTILFHDFGIIYPAIQEIYKQLDEQQHAYVALKLEDNVFAIFFNPDLVHTDPYLMALHKKNKNFWFRFRIKKWVKQYLPVPLIRMIEGMLKTFKKKNAGVQNKPPRPSD